MFDPSTTSTSSSPIAQPPNANPGILVLDCGRTSAHHPRRRRQCSHRSLGASAEKCRSTIALAVDASAFVAWTTYLTEALGQVPVLLRTQSCRYPAAGLRQEKDKKRFPTPSMYSARGDALRLAAATRLKVNPPSQPCPAPIVRFNTSL
jgi:hypothetical protein